MVLAFKKIKKVIKQDLYRFQSLRAIVQIGYEVIVRSEILFDRALDMVHSKPCLNEDYGNVTGVIKTFERPAKLRILLKSIKRTFPTLKLIVVDDSKVPIQLKDIEVITLPYDSGVSAGRASGLDKVTTPFVINLDDDFIFNRNTRLTKAIRYLERNESVDLVAGEVVYLPSYIRYDYSTHKLMDYSNDPIYPKGTVIDGLQVFEKCANFFVARTEKLREVGWDHQLKRLDHADFYTRARGKLTAVFDSEIELLHVQTHFDENYLKVRHEYSQDALVLNKRYPKA